MPAWAHHSFAAAYDLKDPVTVRGVITQVLLRNPHSWFMLDVKNESGQVEQWAFEAGTPSGMIRNGYKPTIIKRGLRSRSKASGPGTPPRKGECSENSSPRTGRYSGCSAPGSQVTSQSGYG